MTARSDCVPSCPLGAFSVVTGALLLGCGGPPPAPSERIDRVKNVRSGAVVARVNGVPITIDDLRVQLAGGKDRRQALQQLIRFELLAQQARRRGIDRHASVRRMQKRAMANLLIRRAFGRRFTKASIPMPLVERAYKLNEMLYDRPEMVRVANLIVFLPKRGKRTDQLRLAARRVAQRARAMARASAIRSAEDLEAIAGKIRDAGDYPPGVRIGFEKLTTQWLPGTREPFSRAAFSLREGELSRVVETTYAYYLIWLKEKTPAHHVTLAQAEPQIREKIFDDARKAEFEKFVQTLSSAHKLQLLVGPLEQTRSAPAGQP